MAIRSGLARGFDLSHPSNRFVLVATPVVGVLSGLATLFSGDDWGAAVENGFGAGGATFLAWAVGREMHPDRVAVATVAALMAPLGLFLASPDLLANALVLLVVRVIAGTTGRDLHWIDVAFLAAVAVPVAFRDSGPGVLTPAVVALGWVAWLEKRHRFEAGMAFALVGALATVSWLRFDATPVFEAVLVLPAALALVSLAGPLRVTAGTDRPGGAISPARVRTARVFGVLVLVAAAVSASPAALAPVLAALAATGSSPR